MPEWAVTVLNVWTALMLTFVTVMQLRRRRG